MATAGAVAGVGFRVGFVDDDGPAGIDLGGVEYAITRDAARAAESE
jgi:hypothetical protein